MTQAQTATPARRSPRVEGTFISAESHPHIFAAYPGIKAQAAENGGRFLMSDMTLSAFEAGSRSGSRQGLMPQTSAPKARAAAASRNTSYDKFFSPAALDRMRGGPPSAQVSEAQVDAYFATRRTARDRYGR